MPNQYKQLPKLSLLLSQVKPFLEIYPELGGGPEETGRPQGRVRCNAPAAPDDQRDPGDIHEDPRSQAAPRDVRHPLEFLLKDPAGWLAAKGITPGTTLLNSGANSV
jgi:hypothetical protein